MSQKSTVLLLFEDPDADAPGVDPEVAFVEVVRSPVGVSFHGKKCSEKGLASEINTSKVCLQGEEIKVYSDAFIRKMCPKLCFFFLPNTAGNLTWVRNRLIFKLHKLSISV